MKPIVMEVNHRVVSRENMMLITGNMLRMQFTYAVLLFYPFLWLKSGIQHHSFLKNCRYVQDQVKDAFLIKVCFKIYFTWDHFIKHKIEIADAIIVFISFILDLVFLNDDAVGGLVGKFIVYRPFFAVFRFAYAFALVASTESDKWIYLGCKTGRR